ncbi:MAG: hypothetical protein ACKO6L_10355 [Flavobacteriales bacterium]
MKQSHIMMDISLEEFLQRARIEHIHDLSIYWQRDEVFHETVSTRNVSPLDILAFIAEHDGLIISVRFICNQSFEVESNGKSETVVTSIESQRPPITERYSDSMIQGEIDEPEAELVPVWVTRVVS